MPFSAKMTKVPLVNPKLTEGQTRLKSLFLTKQHFSWFYIKPELFGDF